MRQPSAVYLHGDAGNRSARDSTERSASLPEMSLTNWPWPQESLAGEEPVESPSLGGFGMGGGGDMGGLGQLAGAGGMGGGLEGLLGGQQ